MATSQHFFQQFFKDVCINERIHDYTLNFCCDSYCWQKAKRIDIDWNYDGDLRQIILHEISHISTARFSNQKHTPEFWKYLEYLCHKYLKQGLDENQLRHKLFASHGFCSLIYYDGPDFPNLKKFPQKFSTGKILAKQL